MRSTAWSSTAIIHGVALVTVRLARWDGLFDKGIVDGLVNGVAALFYQIGGKLRSGADWLAARLCFVSGVGCCGFLFRAVVFRDPGVGWLMTWPFQRFAQVLSV